MTEAQAAIDGALGTPLLEQVIQCDYAHHLRVRRRVEDRGDGVPAQVGGGDRWLQMLTPHL